jgi:Ca2+-binding RTX toxin-like protein
MAAAISGTQGNDTLRGTRQADQIYGLNGNDTLQGRARSDELYGGAGNDNLYGSGGNDDIYGGSGQDDLFGGPGADFLNSADRGTPDIVDCGASDGAMDRVVYDSDDTLRNCGMDTTTQAP